MKVLCSFGALVELHKLIPNPKNTNAHPESQIDLLKKIIDFQGIRHPIIVSKLSGFIVAGHGRLLAAQALGYEKFPVDYQDFENEAQEYLFLESDNHLAELSEHDESKMIDNLKHLDVSDLSLIGIPDFKFEQIDLVEDLSDKNKEINTDNFGSDLEHECPKCGFEFND